MVISHILGGLGNQMFQYAAGRALALSRGVPLRLDISGFDNYGLHNGFELDRIFPGNFEISAESDVHRMLGWRSEPLVRRILRRPQAALLRGSRLIIEPHFNFWPGFLELPDDCYLDGYWQSEKHFKPVEDVIRRDFRFKQEMTRRNRELAEQMRGDGSISLHVRRGDYVTNPKNHKVLSLCPLEYYQTAVSLIAERVEKPHFFIFSDDLPWVKSYLKVDFYSSYIDHNRGAESYNDMRLMSLCRHHIIANSSFSWWGAWLDSRPDKMVIAPARWFTNNNEIADLIPDGWTAT
ncbi:MAG: alpha-1,2-fucosyltransferase [Kiritimatiellales bacterium]